MSSLLPIIAMAGCASQPTADELEKIKKQMDAAPANGASVDLAAPTGDSADAPGTIPVDAGPLASYQDATANLNWEIFSSRPEDAGRVPDMSDFTPAPLLNILKTIGADLCTANQFLADIETRDKMIYASCSSFADVNDHALWIFAQGGESWPVSFPHRLNQIVAHPDDPTQVYGTFHDVLEDSWGVAHIDTTTHDISLHYFIEADGYTPNYAAGITILGQTLYTTTSNISFAYDDQGNVATTYGPPLISAYPIEENGALKDPFLIWPLEGNNSTSLGIAMDGSKSKLVAVNTGLLNLDNEVSESYLVVYAPNPPAATTYPLAHGGLGVAYELSTAGSVVAIPDSVRWRVHLYDIETQQGVDVIPPAIPADETHYTSMAKFLKDGEYLIACEYAQSTLDADLGKGNCGVWSRNPSTNETTLIQVLDIDPNFAGLNDLEEYNGGVLVARGAELLWMPYINASQ